MAEPHDRKPILTIEQQIEHLKQKGVAFELCSEEEAADYLRDKCNFFTLIIDFIRTPPTFIRTCADECGNPIP